MNDEVSVCIPGMEVAKHWFWGGNEFRVFETVSRKCWNVSREEIVVDEAREVERALIF